jgi:undecaprenyl-diphosphatase
MNIFDSFALSFVNEFAGRSIIFDKIMVVIVDQSLIKGGFLMALLWWVWFRDVDDIKSSVARNHIIAIIAGCFFSLLSARILAKSLPFRLRPLFNPDVSFTMPYGWKYGGGLESWSSFPSDHAVMFFALAVGLLFISRAVGILVLIHTVLFICFPRVFLGLHYPSDILAGAFLGTFFGVVFNQQTLMNYITRPFNYWLRKSAGTFYACSFLLTFEIASLFDDIRFLAEKTFKMVFFYL